MSPYLTNYSGYAKMSLWLDESLWVFVVKLYFLLLRDQGEIFPQDIRAQHHRQSKAMRRKAREKI